MSHSTFLTTYTTHTRASGHRNINIYIYIYIYIYIVRTNGKAIIGIATGHKKHEQGKMKLQAKECREQETADAPDSTFF